jgi:hypothetical protein
VIRYDTRHPRVPVAVLEPAPCPTKKVKMLRAVKPMSPIEVPPAVRGQCVSRSVEKRPVAAGSDEPEFARDSARRP